jgi:hypothetical protein
VVEIIIALSLLVVFVLRGPVYDSLLLLEEITIMQSAQIPIMQNLDGSYSPHDQGMGFAVVTYNYDISGKTAIISFAGVNQAVVTFDETGRMVVSYHMLNLMASASDMATVENISRYLASATATLH